MNRIITTVIIIFASYTLLYSACITAMDRIHFEILNGNTHYNLILRGIKGRTLTGEQIKLAPGRNYYHMVAPSEYKHYIMLFQDPDNSAISGNAGELRYDFDEIKNNFSCTGPSVESCRMTQGERKVTYTIITALDQRDLLRQAMGQNS